MRKGGRQAIRMEQHEALWLHPLMRYSSVWREKWLCRNIHSTVVSRIPPSSPFKSYFTIQLSCGSFFYPSQQLRCRPATPHYLFPPSFSHLPSVTFSFLCSSYLLISYFFSRTLIPVSLLSVTGKGFALFLPTAASVPQSQHSSKFPPLCSSFPLDTAATAAADTSQSMHPIILRSLSPSLLFLLQCFC